MTREFEKVAVCPSRLARGEWSHQFNRTVGEGDINAAYSGDRIGLAGAVRKPFEFRGGLWMTTGIGPNCHEAYRLMPLELFAGSSMSYAERCADGDTARGDPNGFYHGMRVKHGKACYVLTGPPLHFVPGEERQPSLF